MVEAKCSFSAQKINNSSDTQKSVTLRRENAENA